MTNLEFKHHEYHMIFLLNTKDQINIKYQKTMFQNVGNKIHNFKVNISLFLFCKVMHAYKQVKLEWHKSLVSPSRCLALSLIL